MTRSRASATGRLRGLHAAPAGTRVRSGTGLDWAGLDWTGLSCPFTAPLLPLHLRCTGLTLSCTVSHCPCTGPRCTRPAPLLHSIKSTEMSSEQKPPSLSPAHGTFRTALANALRSLPWVTSEITRAVGLLAKEGRVFILVWSPDAGPCDVVGSDGCWWTCEKNHKNFRYWK